MQDNIGTMRYRSVDGPHELKNPHSLIMLVLTMGNIYTRPMLMILLKNAGEWVKKTSRIVRIYDVGDLYSVLHQRRGNLVSMARKGDMLGLMPLTEFRVIKTNHLHECRRCL